MIIKRLSRLNGIVFSAAFLSLPGLYSILDDKDGVFTAGDEIVLEVDLPEPEQAQFEPELPETQDSDYLQFEATAYCDYGITFSGVLVQRGIVAADPKILPIGSVRVNPGAGPEASGGWGDRGWVFDRDDWD